MDDTQAFEQWLQTVHKSILNSSKKASYTYLYGIDINSTDVHTLFGGKMDIYDLISQDSTLAYFDVYDVLAFVTFGWAAPVDNDLDEDEIDVDITTAPSAHPQKKRIRLTNFLHTKEPGILSTIDILDEHLKTQETIWEFENNTSGPLKESLLTLYTRNNLYGTGFLIG